jgi:diguanylate cyclase (GGDEF)-like protein
LEIVVGIFRNASIKNKLLAIMVFSGIPIIFAFAYFIHGQYLDKCSDSEKDVLSTIHSIAYQHTAQVEGIRNLLTAFSQYPEARLKDPAECSKLLRLILEKSPSSLNMGVAAPDGRVIATGIRQPVPITYNVADRKYFQDALKTGKFSHGEFTVSRAVGKPTLHFAMPVLDSKGEVTLVLYAALDLTSFSKIFDAQRLPYQSIINLTDYNGTVLLRYSHIDLDNQTGHSDHNDLRGHMTGAQEEGVFSGTGLDGAKRHFAFKRLRLSPTEPPYLYLRVSIPDEIATSGVREAVGISSLVFLLAAALSYLLTKVIAEHQIVRPIEKIVRASKLVESGDLHARSGLLYTNDELGQLAKSFDDMTTSLSDQIVEISRAEAEMNRLAYYDHLTNLPNRRLLQDRLNLALSRSKRQQSGFALMYIDIDNFKNINDSLGHSVGDQLLKAIAARYMSILREDDIVCRLGGDEFAVILHDIRHENDVTGAVEKLLDATSAPFLTDNRELLVSASIGVALYPRDGVDGGSLEKGADLALYKAKDEGKNTFRMFSEELNRVTHERINLSHALQHALPRNELFLYYQPKIGRIGRDVIGVEALLRWNSSEFGLIEPDRFIPIAEESRIIIQIGEWALRTACEQQVAWKKQGYDLSMAVNISAVQFKSNHLIQSVKDIIDETGVNPRQLELELTESCLVDKPTEAIGILEKLRDLKCSIAIDDFGTGYSSLSYLKNFPVTVLKIDRSFVTDLAHNPNDRAIAQSVVNLANNLNMVTVAEGVEHPDQERILEEIGCDYFQGYLYCQPVPPDQIPGFITRTAGNRSGCHRSVTEDKHPRLGSPSQSSLPPYH